MSARTFFLIALLAALASAAQPAHAQSPRGWLGVSYDFVNTFGEQRREEPVVVTRVIVSSPAQRAGLLPGDTVVGIAGRAATHENVMRFSQVAPGEHVRLRLRRAGRERNVVIQAGEWPKGPIVQGPHGRLFVFEPDSLRAIWRMYSDSAQVHFRRMETQLRAAQPRAAAQGDQVHVYRILSDSSWVVAGERVAVAPRSAAPTLITPVERGTLVEALVSGGTRAVAGAEFKELSPRFQHVLGHSRGLLTLSVGPRTPAARAGLREGDLLVRANGRELRLIPQLREAIALSHDAVLLDVVRESKPLRLRLAVDR